MPAAPEPWQELVLIASSREALGLYDGWGRRVVQVPPDLLPAAEFYAGAHAQAADVLGDPRDEILFLQDGILCILGAEADAPAGAVYAPRRRQGISWPAWRAPARAVTAEE